jgi:hypothetical protein
MASAFSNCRLSSMIMSNFWISRSCAFRISAGTSMPCEGVISFEHVLGAKTLILLALRLIPSAAALAYAFVSQNALVGLAVHQGTTFLTDHSISECCGHGDLIFRSAVALMRSHSTDSVMPGRFMTRRVSCAQNSLLP